LKGLKATSVFLLELQSQSRAPGEPKVSEFRKTILKF